MPKRKLTDNDINNVRALLADGMTQQEVADKHEVTRATISDIQRGITHKEKRGRKLCQARVMAIREQLRAGIKQRYLAALYNVAQPTISGINRGVYWK